MSTLSRAIVEEQIMELYDELPEEERAKYKTVEDFVSTVVNWLEERANC